MTSPVAYAPPPKAGFTPGGYASKLGGAISARPMVALGVIVVLAILVIGEYVYFHGLVGFGPYAAAAAALASAKPAAAKPAAPSKGDATTESLIDSINNAAT